MRNSITPTTTASVTDLSQARLVRAGTSILEELAPSRAHRLSFHARTDRAVLIRSYTLYRYKDQDVPQYILEALVDYNIDKGELESNLSDLFAEL